MRDLQFPVFFRVRSYFNPLRQLSRGGRHP